MTSLFDFGVQTGPSVADVVNITCTTIGAGAAVDGFPEQMPSTGGQPVRGWLWLSLGVIVGLTALLIFRSSRQVV
jgi:LPXTG-motif cell wall-anchored protein